VDEILVEDRAGVRCLTLNRAEQANAITIDMAQRLINIVSAVSTDPTVRVVMLTGAGDRTFSAGADLKEMSVEGALGRPYTPILPTLYPTLVVLNGTAVGGGLELALACDLRMAAAGCQVGLPEIKHGIGAVFGDVMLTRSLPGPLAFEMLFTGDLYPVEEVARWGLVKVVPADLLRDSAWELAERVAASAPLAIRKLKAIARHGAARPVLEAMKLDSGPDLYASEDRKEGLRAWREKRPPIWRGR
jgi:enoyl-CoA hydratase/carnithine racemase